MFRFIHLRSQKKKKKKKIIYLRSLKNVRLVIREPFEFAIFIVFIVGDT